MNRLVVAEKAGLSPSTVSRALTDHPAIPLSTRDHVKKIAKALGYIPSLLGKGFYQKKSYRLGLVIPFQYDTRIRSIQGEYFSKTLYGLIRAATAKDFTVNVIADTGLSADELARLVLGHSVDGFVFLGVKIGDFRFDYLAKKKVPFVFIHHREDGKPFCHVDIDSAKGLRLILEHLKSKNVRSVAWVGGNKEYLNSQDREKIFPKLARELGFEFRGSWEGGFSRRGGQATARKILETRPLPDAIVCANDRSAFGVIEVVKAAGTRIPEEIRITAFDNLDEATLITPQLTTVENPLFEIGQMAGEKLLALIEGKESKSVSVEPRLIIRESA